MIDRDEIETTSRLLGVHTSDVQRDYLYGWLLAGVYGDNPLIRDRLVLKGGNAFRKGYFVKTRFSGDLDFAAPAGLDRPVAGRTELRLPDGPVAHRCRV